MTDPVSAVVCLDGLGRAELAFFSVAQRALRGVDFYVYGAQNSTSRLAELVRQGAAEPLTDDVVRRLGQKPASPSERILTTRPSEAIGQRPPAPAEPVASESDSAGDTEVVHKGVVPPFKVVVPGMRPKSFAAGEYHLPCALIIGERNKGTDLKTSRTDVLREFAVQV